MREGKADLGVLSLPVGPDVPLGGEQTLQELHLVQRHVGGERTQAGALAVLVVDLQTLAYEPTGREPVQHRNRKRPINNQLKAA